MSTRVATFSEHPVALALIMTLAAFLFYLLILDQGQTFSLVQGSAAFDQNWLHEFVHDARHVSAVPCH